MPQRFCGIGGPGSLQLDGKANDFINHGSWPFFKAIKVSLAAGNDVGSPDKMGEERKGRVSYVIGPDGSPLTLADLPPPGTRRWVIRRKAEVVAAVRGGLLSLDDACKRYTLTVEEFLAWQRAIDRFGMPGLRATRVQQYRN
jgi:hypothetical protein